VFGDTSSQEPDDFVMLAVSSGKRVIHWVGIRPSVRPSVCVSRLLSNLNKERVVIFLTLIGRMAHTEHDSPEGRGWGVNKRCGQRTFHFSLSITKMDILVPVVLLPACP